MNDDVSQLTQGLNNLELTNDTNANTSSNSSSNGSVYVPPHLRRNVLAAASRDHHEATNEVGPRGRGGSATHCGNRGGGFGGQDIDIDLDKLDGWNRRSSGIEKLDFLKEIELGIIKKLQLYPHDHFYVRKTNGYCELRQANMQNAVDDAIEEAKKKAKKFFQEGNQVPAWFESFGVVPWVKVGENYYILGQVSVSSDQCDMKMDPFRGKAEPEEKTPQQTAARKLWEESAHLLDLRNHAQELGEESKSLYHVILEFEDGELNEFAPQYDENRRKLVRDNEKVEACLGVAFIPVNRIVNCVVKHKANYYIKITKKRIRLASQMIEILREAKSMIDNNMTVPCIALKKVQENNEVNFIPVRKSMKLLALSEAPRSNIHKIENVPSEEEANDNGFVNANEGQVESFSGGRSQG